MQILFYFIVCILATTAGAISGVGGGVIIKPVLDAIGGLSVGQISFLSGCTVLAMTIVSLWSSRKGTVKVDKTRGTLLALGGAVGGIMGKLMFDGIKKAAGNDALVGLVQSIVMVILTVGVYVYMKLRPKIKTKNVENPLLCVSIGLALGVFSAFLGIGGGPINLAVLYYFFSMDTKTAALNSLYVIFFSQCASLLFTFVRGSVPDFSPVMLAVMALGGVAGGMIGRGIAKRISGAYADRFFSVLLIVILLISVYNLFAYVQMI